MPQRKKNHQKPRHRKPARHVKRPQRRQTGNFRLKAHLVSAIQVAAGATR